MTIPTRIERRCPRHDRYPATGAALVTTCHVIVLGDDGRSRRCGEPLADYLVCPAAVAEIDVTRRARFGTPDWHPVMLIPAPENPA